MTNPSLTSTVELGFGSLDQDTRQRAQLISHELRAPLSTVVGVIRRRLHSEQSVEGLARDLKLIERTALHLLSVIDDVLPPHAQSANRHQASLSAQVPPQAKPTRNHNSNTSISINELIEDFTECGTSLCLEHSNTLQIAVHGSVPNLIRVDAKSVRQIVYNLLTNAARCCHQGVIAVRLSCVHRRGAVFLEISVLDTGEGMSNHVRERITAGLPASETPQPHGLGLRVVQQRLTELNGSFDVQSQPGIGTSFSIKVPIQVIESAGWKWVDEGMRSQPPSDLFGEAALVHKVDVQTTRLAQLAALASRGEISAIQQWIKDTTLDAQSDQGTNFLMNTIRSAADRLDMEMILQIASSYSAAIDPPHSLN